MDHRRHSLRGYPAPPALSGVYSVWRGDRYDYYEGGGMGAVGPAWRNPVGTPLDNALPRLPFGARKVGSGEAARGTVVRSGRVGLGDITGLNATQLSLVAAIIAGAIYLGRRGEL